MPFALGDNLTSSYTYSDADGGSVYYFESNDDFDAWALAGETAVESAEFGE